MSKEELDNLVGIRKLKVERASRAEFDGMVASARKRLADAQNESLDPDSQFDLAYGAAHRLAQAALRRQGYRSEDRITVFQTLVHTVGTDPADLQILLYWLTTREIWRSTRAASTSTRAFWPS